MKLDAPELDQVDRCTCYCETCWKVRPDCACSSGPVGSHSGSCALHGDF